MKKILTLIFAISMIWTFQGCSQQTAFDIGITIPAHTTKDFVYQEDFIFSDEEISPKSDTITILSEKGTGDMQVVLMPIQVKEENAYEPTYLTAGMPVKMDVEKGAWFKIGVDVKNNTDEDFKVYINVKDVDVRIE